MEQPTLFAPVSAVDVEKLVLYALGDFQARGKVLADRELALDRLRGAFKRAAAKFATEEPSDAAIAEALEKLGAKVVKVPTFVAKHPFRVTVTSDVADRGREAYREIGK